MTRYEARLTNMRSIAAKVWHSPTVMTWGSFLSRSIGYLIVLPLAVRKLDVGEIVVWYLFGSVYSMQWILDLGFGSTYSRAVTYAAAGAPSLAFSGSVQLQTDAMVNWDLLARIRAVTTFVYLLLAAMSFVLLAIFGTWALIRPISDLPNERMVWVAWTLIVVSFPVAIYGNRFFAYLEGMGMVAIVRRWDMFVGVANSGSMIVALLAGAGLFGLVVCNQMWGLIRIALYWRLASQMEQGNVPRLPAWPPDRALLSNLWAGAWRSGVGGVMSYGLAYAASFLIAQRERADVAATYLMSARLLDALLQLSQAPFYSKLSVLTRLRATGQLSELVSAARVAMTTGYWCFVSAFLVLAVVADRLLVFVGSNAEFASADLWALMGLAAFVQFYGGMHIQLYSTTNHIIWHIANTGAGVIFLVIALSSIGGIGCYAVPLGWLCGYAGFYAWYSASHSYASIKQRFLTFEMNVMLPPLLIMLVYGLATVITKVFENH